MNLDFLQRLNRRERILALGVGAVVFLLVNLFVWSSLLGGIKRAHADVAARSAQRQQQTVFLRERDLWQKRDQWLRAHQPTLKSPAEASALLEQMKGAATKYNILIENPQIGTGESTPQRQTVFAAFETKSPWPPLVQFLYDVQQPEAFIVFDSVSLSVDTTDATMMRGKFKAARWYAPAARK